MSRILILVPCFLVFLVVPKLYAEEGSAQACYESKDRACLEDLKPKMAFGKESEEPKNYDAYYYLALLVIDEGGDIEEAKKNLMVALNFGDGHAKSKAKLLELYETGAVTFDSTECLSIENKECLYALADKDNDKVAQYFIGGQLLEDNPLDAVKYLQKAADQDHKTAKCMLAIGEQDGSLETQQTYHDAVQTIRDECRLMKPLYNRISESYFKKYSSKKTHRAFAFSDSGWSYYRSDYVTPELAARAALESCNATNKKKEAPCKVINIDGQWIKEITPPQFPKMLKGMDKLLTFSAFKSFINGYNDTEATKVFVQSAIGSWSWKSSSSESLDVVTKKALSNCEAQSRYLNDKFPCRVINENGEWK